MDKISLPASYYRQHGADYSLDVPAKGYGGWAETLLTIDPKKTAVIVMHAWDVGSREKNPAPYDACEYVPRSIEISKNIYPSLLAAVRSSDMKLYHVVGGGDYYKKYPGYERAVSMAEPEIVLERAKEDEVLRQMRRFHSENVFPGIKNFKGYEQLGKEIDFLPEARPQGDEGIAESSNQLFALCKEDGVNHLLYTGFAINVCLLFSPGGMVDMSRRGIMCSVLKEAVTAVENRETAKDEVCKELSMWQTSVLFGFVFSTKDLIRAL